jgi:hypothetical protein
LNRSRVQEKLLIWDLQTNEFNAYDFKLKAASSGVDLFRTQHGLFAVFNTERVGDEQRVVAIDVDKRTIRTFEDTYIYSVLPGVRRFPDGREFVVFWHGSETPGDAMKHARVTFMDLKTWQPITMQLDQEARFLLDLFVTPDGSVMAVTAPRTHGRGDIETVQIYGRRDDAPSH